MPHNHNISHVDKGLDDYPEELKGSWIQLTFLPDHPVLDGICCLYFNDKHPSGTVLFSEYIDNEYPDIYATWDKDIYSNRMLINPIIRNRGIASAGLNYGTRILLSTGKVLKYYPNDFNPGNALWKAAFGDVIVSEGAEDHSPTDEESFEQPIYPHVFFYKRRIL